MLDTSQCVREITKWHLLLKSSFNLLTTPVLMLLLLLALLVLSQVVRRKRWRRRLYYVGYALVVTYLIGSFQLTVDLAYQGLVALLPPDSGAKADAIVILGRGLNLGYSRVHEAANLWQANRAPLIFASGMTDAPRMVEQLREKGIPNSGLDGERCSQTTEENAEITAMALQSQGKKQIVLVTDPPHMLRSLLTFRAKGFTVIPHPSPRPSGFPAKAKADVVYKEYIGLTSYGLLGRFFPQQSPVKNSDSR